MLVDASFDLPQMMKAMDLMKASPLLRREWSQDGMDEHVRVAPEAFFRVGQGGIHCYQGIIKLTQRFASQRGAWRGLFGRFNAGREPADAEHVETAEPMTHRAVHTFDLS